MRTNGILMAVSSLPSKTGIGDFNKASRQFIDSLKLAGIKIWQVLPLNPVGYGSSPYQSECGFALDPLYISLEYLKEKKYLTSFKEFSSNSKRVEYDKVRAYKDEYFLKAYKLQKDTTSTAFKKFLKDNSWCEEYARFHVLFLKNEYLDWNLWDKKEKYAHYQKFDFTPYEEDILYYEWLQFIAYSEYELLRKYAKENGVQIMGDIPFYVGFNSSDVWANQDEFLLDEVDAPTHVAGVPPDYFALTGQRWGNPIYDWEFIKEENFEFWLKRIRGAAKLYDLLRIDHFRAFDTYYKIPVSCPTAVEGTWEEAPGIEFFETLVKENINIEIVAEDLGEMFPSVFKLRDRFALKGMNVVEFTFLDENFEISKNQLIYTGTHDNDTLKGWYKSLDSQTKASVDKKIKDLKLKGKGINEKLIDYAFKSICDIVIIPIQDYLKLDSYYRMNIPGTCASPDWEFKLDSLDEFNKLIPYILKLNKTYKR
ncbi:MAG TPA: 4-alpha-glucanotransferase [Candidatus Onthovivens sp.]|nr:4-alpha-glucanotransferase [Candidatus Onthovivens sp.]